MQHNSTIFNRVLSDRSWFATALVALLMPFYHNWSIIAIGIFFLVLLTDPEIWKHLMTFTQKRLLYSMILLFVMYGIGLFYSTNKGEAWTDLQTALPLFLFPVFLSALDYSKKDITDFVMFSFMIGCLISGLICLGIAIFSWLSTGANHFFYVQFSIFMHPSYFALYLNLIMCYLYQKLIFEDATKRLKVSLIIFILFFINGLILLLSSKAGIFTAGLVQLIMLIVSIIRKKNGKMAIYIFLGMSLFYFVFYKVIIPVDQERMVYSEQTVMSKPLSNTSSESSSLRLLIWKSSLPLVKKTFLTGVGTGDVKDELMKVYKDNGITTAYEKELNAHNQFLQTILAIGLPGFVLLLLSLILPLLRGIRTNDFLLYMFFLISAFNFLFESMLERQIGVVYFAFFGTFLIVVNSMQYLIQNR